MKADLHFHSIYSDGALSPAELVVELKKNNIDFACLTDHDSIMGSEEFVKIAKENGILSFPGLELSTYEGSESIHILGYFKDTESIKPEFKEYLLSMIEQRRNRMRTMVDNMNKLYNLHIDFNEILENHPYMIERPHLASIMAREMNITIKEVFDKYIGNDCPGYVKSSKISTSEGVKMIHDAGGIAVMAHPYHYSKNDPKELIKKIMVDGVEVYYFPTKTRKYRQFRKFANKNNLLQTGGSDFHRYNDGKHASLGSKEFDEKYMKEFIEKLKSL